MPLQAGAAAPELLEKCYKTEPIRPLLIPLPVEGRREAAARLSRCRSVLVEKLWQKREAPAEGCADSAQT